MAARRFLAPATRALSLTTGTGFQHLLVKGISTAPRACLPNLGPLPFSGLPLSSASRGALTTLGNASFLQGPAYSLLCQFSTNSGGGKMPAWMDANGRTPAEIFRDLDCHGQNVVILSYYLMQENGVKIESSLSTKMHQLEGRLMYEIEATPDRMKVKLDGFAVEGWLRSINQVAFLGMSMYGFFQIMQFAGRFLEALGQMRKHSAEIVDHFSRAYMDSTFKPNLWPFVKFEFVVQDRWWIDPVKQAKRDAKAQKKLAKKEEDGDPKK